MFNRQKTIRAFSLLGTVTDFSLLTVALRGRGSQASRVIVACNIKTCSVVNVLISTLPFKKRLTMVFMYDLEKRFAIRITTAVNSC